LRIHDEGTKLRKRFGPKEQVDIRSDFDSASPSTSTSTHSQSTESSPEDSLELISHYGTPEYDRAQGYRADLVLPAKNVLISLLETKSYLGFESSNGENGATGFDGLLSGGAVNFDIPFQMVIQEPISSPYLAQEQLLQTFSTSITSTGPAVIPRQMHSHIRWLSQLPALFGSKLLDTAVRAVSLVHLGRLQQSDVCVQESRQFYGKALRLLNQSLADGDKGMATETLSSTILLSFYEMFASDSNESWVRHAGGAGALMRIRGPKRHLSGMDRDVYLAYRHTIVIDAFQRDEACFLSEPEWLEMAHQIHEDLRATGMSDDRMVIFDLAEEFYVENVFIPTTCRDVKYSDDMRLLLSPDDYAAYELSLREKCRQHRARLKSINLRFRAALQSIGLETTVYETPDPVFPTQYSYVNVFIASTNVGYYTVMIILNLCLRGLEKESAPGNIGLYLMENREIAREICRTAPYMMTSSFLGPFFITFALRLCLLVFGPGKERDWVLKKLVQIGATHMRMAADIPDFEPAATGIYTRPPVDPNHIPMILDAEDFPTEPVEI
jgi:hypothetical protein